MSNFSNQVFASPGIRYKTDAEQKNEDDITDLDVRMTAAEMDINTLFTEFESDEIKDVAWQAGNFNPAGTDATAKTIVSWTRVDNTATITFTSLQATIPIATPPGSFFNTFVVGLLPSQIRPIQANILIAAPVTTDDIGDDSTYLTGRVRIQTDGRIFIKRNNNDHNENWTDNGVGKGFLTFSVSYKII